MAAEPETDVVPVSEAPEAALELAAEACEAADDVADATEAEDEAAASEEVDEDAEDDEDELELVFSETTPPWTALSAGPSLLVALAAAAL